MEDELRLFLLLGGTVFIIGVLAHGIWKIRKNSKPEQKTRLEPRQWQEDMSDDDTDNESDAQGFDELGLGEVRVVSRTEHPDPEQVNLAASDGPDVSNDVTDSDDASQGTEAESDQRTEALDGDDGNDSDKNNASTDDSTKTIEEAPKPQPKLYGSVVSNPKPHMAASMRGGHDSAQDTPNNVADFPEPPGFLLKEGAEESNAEHDSSPQSAVSEAVESNNAHQQEVADFSLDAPEQPERVELDAREPNEQQKRFSRTKRAKQTTRKREEPNFGDDQMRIDFDENDNDPGFSANDDAHAVEKGREKVEPEVLVLNVRAPEDAPIAGAALLPMLLTLGFKFGDQDIFHRHVNSNGKGPVLFSLANMFKPGVFDIDNLENFETQGVSLFMILPIEGDPHQVFNMMHNAARKLADEFNAQVLDGRRSVLTKQGLQQYVEKIREFERKRIIARN